MPSPVGHAIAGLTTAWIAEIIAPSTAADGSPRSAAVLSGLTIACIAAAMSPDLDILVDSHRTYTHSIGAAALVGLMVWLVMRRLSPSPVRIAIIVTSAYFSHVLLDWLGKDTSVPPGLMALWPLSSKFYLSQWNVFPEISRRYWRPDEFMVGNLKGAVREVAILGPVAALAWWMRKTRAR